MLSKKDILAVSDIKCEEVEVIEWGGSVMVYGLTGKQRGELEASVVEMRGQTQIMHLQNLKVLMCSMAIRDENGARMFDSDEVDELGAKSTQALERVYDVAQRLSGMSTTEVEKLSKNFVGEAVNGGSGSASR